MNRRDFLKGGAVAGMAAACMSARGEGCCGNGMPKLTPPAQPAPRIPADDAPSHGAHRTTLWKIITSKFITSVRFFTPTASERPHTARKRG